MPVTPGMDPVENLAHGPGLSWVFATGLPTGLWHVIRLERENSCLCWQYACLMSSHRELVATSSAGAVPRPLDP